MSEGLEESSVFRSCVQLAAKIRDWVVKYSMADRTPGVGSVTVGGGTITRGMAMTPKQLKKIMNRRMQRAKVFTL